MELLQKSPIILQDGTKAKTRGNTFVMRSIMAEGAGFEPARPLGPAVFKTAAFNHSATPPHGTHLL